jgi:uncharacterized protein (TIGR03435 family)
VTRLCSPRLTSGAPACLSSWIAPSSTVPASRAYDFTLAYTLDLPPGVSENTVVNGAPLDTSGPTVFEALRQQLGLRLEPRREPVQIMMIDHAEMPTAN